MDRGTLITVDTNSDTINGNVSGVNALLSSPGPDGISLPEAITATNNEPGVYTIRFDTQLMGSVIAIGPNGLPPLEGGNVIVNGDIDGDETDDVTIINQGAKSDPGFVISSSDNILHALGVEDFRIGVWFFQQTTDTTYANTIISNLRIRAVGEGILLQSAPLNGVIPTRNRFINTTIVGNVIESELSGIEARFHFSAENRIERLVIINNTIHISKNGLFGIHAGAGFWAGSQLNKIVNVVIAHNFIDGAPEVGIRVAAGDAGATSNTIEGVRIIGNRLQLTATPGGPSAPTILTGIGLIVGDAATDFVDPNFRPVTYPENNRISNAWIIQNSIDGAGEAGVSVDLGSLGGRRNSIDNISILGNTITGIGFLERLTTSGVRLGGGGGLSIVEKRPTSENGMSNVLIQANTIRLVPQGPFFARGGVAVAGGDLGSRNNRIGNVWVSHNDVDPEGNIGINVLGGWGTSELASDNTVSLVEVWCNRVATPPSTTEVRGINVAGGFSLATGNKVEQIRLQDNLVAGVLDDISVSNNLSGGASGNVVELAIPCALTCPDRSLPVIGIVTNQSVYRAGDRMVVTLTTEPKASTGQWFLIVVLVTPISDANNPFFVYRFDPAVELITLKAAVSRPSFAAITARPLQSVTFESLVAMDLTLPAFPAGSYQGLAVFFSEDLSTTSNVAVASFTFR